jgi:hypothetical protein
MLLGGILSDHPGEDPALLLCISESIASLLIFYCRILTSDRPLFPVLTFEPANDIDLYSKYEFTAERRFGPFVDQMIRKIG